MMQQTLCLILIAFLIFSSFIIADFRAVLESGTALLRCGHERLRSERIRPSSPDLVPAGSFMVLLRGEVEVTLNFHRDFDDF